MGLKCYFCFITLFISFIFLNAQKERNNPDYEDYGEYDDVRVEDEPEESNKPETDGPKNPSARQDDPWYGLRKVDITTYAWMRRMEHSTSIDYTNRPEYFGLRRAACPNCVPATCLVESDILCPYEQYVHCNVSYFECANRNKSLNVAATHTLHSQLWNKENLGEYKRYIIPYEIVMTYTETATLRTQAWLFYITKVMKRIEEEVCVHFYDINTNPKNPKEVELRDAERRLKIVETDCLCGVNRLGQKLDSVYTEVEVNETIIFWPTWRTDLVKYNLKEIYGTDDIQHTVSNIGRDDRRITCSYYDFSLFHLLFHALGLGHANNRPDRDNYVFVNEENIPHDNKFSPINKFFLTTNFELNDFGLYRRVQPNHSMTFMDPMAWSKFQSLITFSPNRDYMNPIWWQRYLHPEDFDSLRLLYGRPKGSTCDQLTYDELMREKQITGRETHGCPQLSDSHSAIRVGRDSNNHYGAKVRYRCKKDSFVMIGDSMRMCQRSGHWSGEQPFCVDPTLLTYYCASHEKEEACTGLTHRDDDKGFRDGQWRDKRSVESETGKRLVYYDTKELTAVSVTICIRFVYYTEENSIIEVYVHQNGQMTSVFHGRSSAITLQRNEIKTVASVQKNKPFTVKIIGRFKTINEMTIKHLHVLSNHCDNY